MGDNAGEREATTSESRQEIARRVDGLGKRLFVRNTLRSLSVAIPLLVLAWSCVLLVSRTGLIGQPPGWALPTLSLVVVLASVAIGYAASPRRGEVPLVLDRILETREVLTTACEDAREPDHPLRREARRRALELLSGARPRKALPLMRWRSWRALPIAVAVLGATVFVPQRVTTAAPDEDEAERLAQVGQALEQQVDSLERRDDWLEAEELSEAIGKLQQLSVELQLGETIDREETLLALDSANRLLDDYSQRMRAGAESDDEIEPALEQLISNPFTEDLGLALSSGDGERLRQAVLSTAEALSSADLEDERQQQQLQQAADLFREVAKALRRQGLIDEAGVLDDLARALRDGDLDKASELLQSTVMLGAFDALGQDQLSQEVARDLVEAINLARYLLGQGSPMPLGEGCVKPGQGSTPGPMPGTESTNEAADSFEAGDPLLRDRQTDTTSDRRGAYESLYEPHIIEAESWVDVQVKAGTGISGSFLTEIGRSAGTGDEADHPTRFIAAPAAGGAERAAELEHVPPGYRDVVRRYFAREAAQQKAEDKQDE